MFSNSMFIHTPAFLSAKDESMLWNDYGQK